MPLLCRFGLHRPSSDEIWNKGFYFSTCRRCAADIVRTPAGKWHVPKGRKVVWKPRSRPKRKSE